MRKLHILHTIETSGPGGAENVLLSLVKGLNRDHFQSLVVLNGKGWLEERLREAGVEVICVEWKHWWDLKLPRALAEIIREREIDLVHSHLPDQNFYSCLAGRMTGCPVVVTYHGPVELHDANRLRGWLKLRTVKSTAARVVVVCDFVREMLSKIGFAERQLHRIYNGIAIERFRSAVRGTLRLELKLPAGAMLVGMVGNVRGPKGQEHFIRAARRIADKESAAHFVISGDLHPTLTPPLRLLVNELGLQEKVHFLGFRSDVPHVLADLDVFVLPSTSEGFPLVVLEAMAASRAVVATRCGGAEETVVDGKTGLLVPVGDDEAIAEAVMKLLHDPQLRAQLASAGHRECTRSYSVSTMIESYESLYRECIPGAAATEELSEAAYAGGRT
jgi:glycosyltransferase involved in cell wall biosynthesis